MDWIERLAEEKIRQAREKGVFQKNKYFGRPVPLEPENPHLPREWWAAFHILEINQLAPLWIMQGRWLREAIQAWREALRYVLRRSPKGDPAREVALRQLRDQLETINRHVQEYNWRIPRGATPMAPLRWEDEYQQAGGR